MNSQTIKNLLWPLSLLLVVSSAFANTFPQVQLPGEPDCEGELPAVALPECPIFCVGTRHQVRVVNWNGAPQYFFLGHRQLFDFAADIYRYENPAYAECERIIKSDFNVRRNGGVRTTHTITCRDPFAEPEADEDGNPLDCPDGESDPEGKDEAYEDESYEAEEEEQVPGEEGGEAGEGEDGADGLDCLDPAAVVQQAVGIVCESAYSVHSCANSFTDFLDDIVSHNFPEPSAELVQEIQELIPQLGAETDREREEADDRLREIGLIAFEELIRVFETTDDPEVRLRIRDILRYLGTLPPVPGVSPQPPADPAP